jgi:hypothetical protein
VNVYIINPVCYAKSIAEYIRLLIGFCVALIKLKLPTASETCAQSGIT